MGSIIDNRTILCENFRYFISFLHSVRSIALHEQTTLNNAFFCSTYKVKETREKNVVNRDQKWIAKLSSKYFTLWHRERWRSSDNTEEQKNWPWFFAIIRKFHDFFFDYKIIFMHLNMEIVHILGGIELILIRR